MNKDFVVFSSVHRILFSLWTRVRLLVLVYYCVTAPFKYKMYSIEWSYYTTLVKKNLTRSDSILLGFSTRVTIKTFMRHLLDIFIRYVCCFFCFFLLQVQSVILHLSNILYTKVCHLSNSRYQNIADIRNVKIMSRLIICFCTDNEK